MSYFDMILAKKLSGGGGGGGGGGGSIEPFRGLVFDGEITTTLTPGDYCAKNTDAALYFSREYSLDIVFDGVTYNNIPCEYDPELQGYAAWGEPYDSYGTLQFSTYPFRIEVAGNTSTFFTRAAGTYSVEVTAVLTPSAAPVTFVNQMEDEVWLTNTYDDRYSCMLPAGSTTQVSIPLTGGISRHYEISASDSFTVTTTGGAVWAFEDYNYFLTVYGPGTVTITTE